MGKKTNAQIFKILKTHSPFKGQGANQAILDGLLLGRKWYKMCSDNQDVANIGKNDDVEIVTNMLREFETEMMGRAVPKVKASEEAARALHSGNVLKQGNFTRGKL